jgi:hypothetical protein
MQGVLRWDMRLRMVDQVHLRREGFDDANGLLANHSLSTAH